MFVFFLMFLRIFCFLNFFYCFFLRFLMLCFLFLLKHKVTKLQV